MQLSRFEVLQLALVVEQKRLATELHNIERLQIKPPTPKPDFTTGKTVEEAAKALGTGRTRLFSWLRMEGVLTDRNRCFNS